VLYKVVGPTGVQGGLVGDHVLDPVVHHQGDEVATLHADGRQPGRDLHDTLALLPPGQRAPGRAVAPPRGRLVAVPVGVVAQQVAEGATGDLPLDPGALGKDRVAVHDTLRGGGAPQQFAGGGKPANRSCSQRSTSAWARNAVWMWSAS
jgi:hypothetical protein